VRADLKVRPYIFPFTLSLSKGETTYLIGALQFLALRAEIATTISDGKALDGCAAYRTWFAAAVRYAEVVVCRAQLSVRPFIGVNAGTLAFDG